MPRRLELDLDLGQHLTVGQLKAFLRDVPDHLLVYTEGCDCFGPSGGAYVEDKWGQDDRSVLIIGRDDSIKD